MIPPRPDKTFGDPASSPTNIISVPPRLDKTCSDPVSLPIEEIFTPTQTVTMFSRPFHAPLGTNITVTVVARLDNPGNPDLASVGVRVRQCCVVSDSDITNRDTVGKVGTPAGVEETSLNVQLTDHCDLATKSGDDFVYYLRLSIDSPNQNVVLDYRVE